MRPYSREVRGPALPGGKPPASCRWAHAPLRAGKGRNDHAEIRKGLGGRSANEKSKAFSSVYAACYFRVRVCVCACVLLGGRVVVLFRFLLNRRTEKEKSLLLSKARRCRAAESGSSLLPAHRAARGSPSPGDCRRALCLPPPPRREIKTGSGMVSAHR